MWGIVFYSSEWFNGNQLFSCYFIAKWIEPQWILFPFFIWQGVSKRCHPLWGVELFAQVIHSLKECALDSHWKWFSFLMQTFCLGNGGEQLVTLQFSLNMHKCIIKTIIWSALSCFKEIFHLIDVCCIIMNEGWEWILLYLPYNAQFKELHLIFICERSSYWFCSCSLQFLVLRCL